MKLIHKNSLTQLLVETEDIGRFEGLPPDRDSNSWAAFLRGLRSDPDWAWNEEGFKDAQRYREEGKNNPNVSAKRKLKQMWNERVYGAVSGRTQGVPGAGFVGDPFGDPPEGLTEPQLEKWIREARFKRAQVHRAKFWEEQPGLTMIHYLNFVSNKDLPAPVVMNNIFARIGKYPISPQEHDLSACGFYNVEPTSFGCDCGFEIEGRVTLATSGDAWTEMLSTATRNVKELHAGSGLPKRPTTRLNPTSIILEPADIIERGDKIGELIVEHWTIKSIYISKDAGKQSKKRLRSLAKRYNYPINYFEF